MGVGALFDVFIFEFVCLYGRATKTKMNMKLFLHIKFEKFILNNEFLEISVLWGLFERKYTQYGQFYRHG